MSFQSRHVRAASLCLFLIVTAYAQSDRGTITGTVSDSSNAVVPGAKILATSVETGNKYETVTTATGNFTLPSLPKGTYDVSVQAAGFSRVTQPGNQVEVAQTIRLDFVLKVGSVAESLIVTAEAPLLRTENAEQSTNISGDRINSLPMNFGGGGNNTGQIRNWLSFLVLSPGVSGTDESAPLNNSPANSFKIYLDGQDATSSNDVLWESSVGSASVENIGEFSLQTSNYSAEFGAINGGLFNFTTKSGTNQLHGSGYEYFTNEALDAATPFTKALPRERKNDFGFSLGGPVYIPKLYNGRNKTFFYFNEEWFHNVTVQVGTYSTVPTLAYRSGDFSGALTGRTLTSTLDPVGRPINENVIYDPATERPVNGSVVRDPFPGNVIPQARLDPVAVKIQNLIPQPNNSGLVNNWAQVIPGYRRQAIPSFRIDHDLSSLSRLSFYYSHEVTSTPYWGEGLPFPLSEEKVQTIQNSTARLNLDRTWTPTLLSHIGVGLWRLHNLDSSPSSVLDYDAVGLLGFSGSATTPAGFPRITGLSNAEGGVGPNGGAMGPINANSYYDTKVTAVASTTYVRSDHTYKIGAETKLESWTDRGRRGSQGTLNFSATESGLPSTQGMSLGGGSVGFPYASFLLGLVDTATVNAPQDPQWRKQAWSLYIQDTWKVTHKLTLDYGIRWDRPSQGHEIWWRTSTFSAAVANPSAGGLPGGMAYAGYGPGRCNCNFENNYPYAIGPRLGVAYRLAPKTVLRGGVGITYGALPEYYYMTNSALLGLGYNQVALSNPGYGEPAATLKGGLQYDRTQLYAVTLNPGLTPSPGQLNAPTMNYDPNGGRPPRILQWNVALQREFAKNLSLEVADVGNRAIWLEADNLINYNAIPDSTFKAYGLDLNNSADRQVLTSQIGSALAASRGFKVRYAGYPTTTTVAQSLRPFPQFSGSLTPIWAPVGDSWYDALQTKLVKRTSHGLELTSAFTWQKEQSLGTGGYTGNRGASVNNVFNRANQKGLSSSSIPLILVVGFNYRTPKLGSNKLVRHALGDWVFGGVLRYSSGSLISVPSSNNSLNSVRFQSTRMNRVAGQPLFLKEPNCGCIDPNKDFVLNPAAWSDAPAGNWGYSSVYYNDYRWQHQASEQVSLGRSFQLREKISFQIRAEFFNVFNRMFLPGPSSGNPAQTQTRSSAGVPTAGFGYINATSAGGQRNGQLVARFQF